MHGKNWQMNGGGKTNKNGRRSAGRKSQVKIKVLFDL